MSLHETQSIATAYNIQFKDEITHLSQQTRSRLATVVSNDFGGLQGFEGWYKFLAPGEAIRVIGDWEDTPLDIPQHTSRRITKDTVHIGYPVSREHTARIVNGEALPMHYMRMSTYALQRGLDKTIINAVNASVEEMDDNTRVISKKSFPSGNVIAASNTGLTLDKLKETLAMLLEAEAKNTDGTNMGETKFYIAVASKQFAVDLLTSPELTSSDYNEIKALVSGQNDHFMGFEFLRVGEALEKVGDNRRCFAFASNAFGLVQEPVIARIGERPDKSYHMQTYAAQMSGCTRLEDAKVVQIMCKE